jgi:hypothetical protein
LIHDRSSFFSGLDEISAFDCKKIVIRQIFVAF